MELYEFDDLVEKITQAIPRQEGFRKGKPTDIPNRFLNPGNVRFWDDKHPIENAEGHVIWHPKAGIDMTGYYINFRLWAKENNKTEDEAVTEGFRVLRGVVAQYIRGKYHGHSPNLLEMFDKFAPSKDKNNPVIYAGNISKWTGIPINKPLMSLVK